jgi:hypothetical protein
MQVPAVEKGDPGWEGGLGSGVVDASMVWCLFLVTTFVSFVGHFIG